ncbi:unnamed protein product, partial [Effrenium voratum]
MGILVAEPEGEVTTAGEQEDRVTDGEVRGREAGRPVEVNPFWSEKARAEAELQAHRLAKVIIREHIEDGLQKLMEGRLQKLLKSDMRIKDEGIGWKEEITESWKWASRAGLREAAFGGERHPRGSKSIGEGSSHGVESSYEGHGEATDAGLPHDPKDGDGKGIAEKDRFAEMGNRTINQFREAQDEAKDAREEEDSRKMVHSLGVDVQESIVQLAEFIQAEVEVMVASKPEEKGPKVAAEKGVVEEKPGAETPGQRGQHVQELLCEATGLLKSLKTVKAIRVRAVKAEEEFFGLLDGGATHALRQAKEGELQGDRVKEVTVELAAGTAQLRQQKDTRTLLSPEKVEPIVPLAGLVEMGYGITWNNKGCIVKHPAKGDIKAEMKNGCPMVKGGGSLQLTEDLENFSLL